MIGAVETSYLLWLARRGVSFSVFPTLRREESEIRVGPATADPTVETSSSRWTTEEGEAE